MTHPNTAGMIDASVSLDEWYARWRRLGINFTGRACSQLTDLEALIVTTAGVASRDERLTVNVASWLAEHHALVDGRRLSELTRVAPARTRAYLGALLSLAIEAPDGVRRAPQLTTALAHCRPMARARAFYDSVEAHAPGRAWMRERSIPLFQRWRLWHDDCTLQRRSIYPLSRLLAVPELRARAIGGPSLEAHCIARAP